MAQGGGDEQADTTHVGTHDVFVSYASMDIAVAEATREALEQAGVKCWIAPRDVTPGTYYAGQIIHAIDAAKAIVLILSQHAASSPHVLREVERAASKRHPIVSLRIDQAPLPADFEYFLNTSQWLDASGREIARSVPKLIAAVQVAIRAPTRFPPAASVPTSAQRASAGSAKRTWVVAASLVGLVIIGFAAHRVWESSRKTSPSPVQTAAVPASAVPTIPEKSVAVLPFVDMSEKKDQEYFSDGMAEELIDMLTKVPDLRVPARTSSFYFKGKQAKIPEVARDLGVSHLLEGSVRKSGNTLRITAQLIRADTGYHVWSETYDRKSGDIFKIQDDIARAVVAALRASLATDMTASRPKQRDANSYDLLKQAQFFLLRTTPEDHKKALEYYQRAVDADPESAAAWAGLARATANSAVVGAESAEKVRGTARRAAERAVSLDPNLPESHIALGKVGFNLDRDFPLAKREFDRARALEPDNSVALYWTAVIASTAGDLTTAVQLLESAIARDPLDGELYAKIGQLYSFAARFPEAEASLRKAMDLIPARPGLHSNLGIVLVARGQREAALQEISREVDPEARATSLAFAYLSLGRTAEAQSVLAKLEAEQANSDAYSIAQIYAAQGKLNPALAWLDRAYRQNEFLFELKIDPWFKSVRSDPRFKAILRKLNLPE